jgi:hypothetical protein
VDKLRGLSESDARRRLVPSPTTPIGLVKHLAGVERNWFQHIVAGRPRDEIAGDARGGDDSWQVDETETIPALIAARHGGHADILREQIDGVTGA